MFGAVLLAAHAVQCRASAARAVPLAAGIHAWSRL